MKSKTSLKLILLIVGITGILVSSTVVLYPTRSVSGRGFETKSVSANATQTPEGLINGNSVEPVKTNALLEQASVPALSTQAGLPIEASKAELSAVETVAVEAAAGLPIRLKIPRISVDAAFVYVGLTSLGAMDVPKGPAPVAWLDLGPRPGESGNAVIAGHFGWKNGIPAVFDDLGKLQKGDKVYVEDDKGATHMFVVRAIQIYGEDDVASEVFISSDGKSHLNLVTCGGVWNKTKKSYSDRFVVFTDKVL